MSGHGDKRPLYRAVRDRIASDIAAGFWSPGDAIGAEAHLASKHKVGINTVRRAIDLLVLEGVVVRVQGAGTFVRRPDFETASVRLIRCHGSAGDPRTPTSRILDRAVVEAPSETAAALNLDTGARVIRLWRLRVQENIPVAIEEIWLDAERFAPILSIKDAGPQLMYPLYEHLCGHVVASVQESVTFGCAGETRCRRAGRCYRHTSRPDGPAGRGLRRQADRVASGARPRVKIFIIGLIFVSVCPTGC